MNDAAAEVERETALVPESAAARALQARIDAAKGTVISCGDRDVALVPGVGAGARDRASCGPAASGRCHLPAAYRGSDIEQALAAHEWQHAEQALVKAIEHSPGLRRFSSFRPRVFD